MIHSLEYQWNLEVPEKYDYTYNRKRTATIFVAVDFKGGERDIAVTNRWTRKDFALYMKHLVNNTFSDSKKVKNCHGYLDTHDYYFILKTFEFKEAVELISKLEFIILPNMPVDLMLPKQK